MKKSDISMILLTAEWWLFIGAEENLSLSQAQQDVFPLYDIITWIWMRQQVNQNTVASNQHTLNKLYLKIWITTFVP